MKCSRCGGSGHNAKTCGRKAIVTASGVRVRQVAPGVSGAELAELDPPTPARRVRPDPTRPPLRLLSLTWSCACASGWRSPSCT